MAITDDARQQADAHMSAERDHAHAVSARYDRRTKRVIVRLHSGLELAIPPALVEIEISPSGLGLHWPQLDADVYVPALLAGQFGSRQWMARQIGAVGGRSRSDAKRLAARANGAKGGRPRKAQG